jgi:hypothetical protein
MKQTKHMNINVQKEEKMKKLLVPTMMGVLFLLAPFYAIAADVTGAIQGYNTQPLRKPPLWSLTTRRKGSIT